MSQPTLSDVHVNRPLTDMSVMCVYDEKEFIADQVFPNIPVDKKTDSYFKYTRGDFNRAVAKKRAPGAESAGGGWGLSTDTYEAHVHALHHDIADQIRSNQDDPLNEDEDAVIFLTHQLLLRRELDWKENFFTTGIWTGGADTANCGLSSTDVTVNVAWDNTSGVPIKCIKEQILANKAKTGFRANTLVLPESVWNALQDSADFLDRIKGGATSSEPAVVMPKHLAAVLGLERVLIAGAVQNTAAEGATESSAMIFDDAALLCYVAPRPGKRIPSAGYTFAWRQYGAADMSIRMKRFRMEPNAADRVEGELAYGMKVVAAEMGVYFTNVLT